MLNITTFLDANSKRLDKNVLYNPRNGEKYTSKEILSIVSEIGRKLKESDINKGDRVLIYLANGEEYLFSLFAIWRIGAIAIPTNRVFTASELQYIIDDSKAKLMINICPADFFRSAGFFLRGGIGCEYFGDLGDL